MTAKRHAKTVLLILLTPLASIALFGLLFEGVIHLEPAIERLWLPTFTTMYRR
jgi:hypothetical protein